ncbi:MAG: YceI family protein [Candidatus Acidiferrales bacterium]
MRTMLRVAVVGAVLFACSGRLAQAEPNTRTIDRTKSSIVIHVYKMGFFSAFAHNHEIDAPIESGEVADDGDQGSVDIHVDARKLRVTDQEASADTRAQIQKTMLGSQVLDANRYPEIHFQSVTVERKGANSWSVNGTLELHGQKHPVTAVVTLKDGLYLGFAVLKQTDFGITPVAVAGGTVKVKDEARVEFRIAPIQ